MKINLNDYKVEERREVQWEYQPKRLDLETVDLKYEGSVALDGVVCLENDSLHFFGQMRATLARMCARCLKTDTHKLNQAFDLFYETKDVDSIDTTDDLREALILNQSETYLCREDCRGLCPHCGVNRNETDCDCQSKVLEEPLSPLGKVLREQAPSLSRSGEKKK